MVWGPRPQILEDDDHAHLVAIKNLDDFLVLLSPVVSDERCAVFGAPPAVLIVFTASRGRVVATYGIRIQPKGSKGPRHADAPR